jgi:multidrug resistance protein, MATE family
MIERWFPRDRTRELLILGLPILAGMVSQTVLNLVDTAMVGRLGPAPQGAAGLGSFAFWVLANLVIGIGTGVQATVSRRDGEDDTEGAGAALDTGLIVAFVVGLPLGWLLAQSAPRIFSLLSSDAEVVTGGSGYLAIRLMAIGAVAANYCFRGFFNGIGQSRVYMTTIAASHVANVFLNWVFIYGNLGAEPMGVRGAALASVLATILATCLYTGLTLARADVRRRYRPFRFESVTGTRLAALIRLSWPEAVRGVGLMMGYLLFLRLHAELGTRAVAAGTILINIASTGFLPALGIGLACSTMVGRHLGRGEPGVARDFAWLGVRVSMVGLAVPALLAGVFAEPILGLFTRDALVIAAAKPALQLFAISAVVDALPMVLVFSLLGAGATRFVAAVQMAQQYILLLPLAALLGLWLDFGVFGMWVALLLSRIAVSGVAIRKLRGDDWTRIEV